MLALVSASAMATPFGRVRGEPRLPSHRQWCPKNSAQRHANTRREREYLARAFRLRGGKHDAIHEVVDVDGTEYALPAVREQELTRTHHFQRHDHPRTGCRPVDIARPDDGAVDLSAGMGREHRVFARDLRVDVGIAAGDERMRLVDIRREIESEGSHGRELHESSDALLAASRQEPAGPVAIHVPRRAHRGDHRDHRSRVNDEIGAGQLVAPSVRLAHVTCDDVPLGIGSEIDATDLGAKMPVPLGQGPPDETIGPRDAYASRRHEFSCCDHWHSLAPGAGRLSLGPYTDQPYGLL